MSLKIIILKEFNYVIGKTGCNEDTEMVYCFTLKKNLFLG